MAAKHNVQNSEMQDYLFVSFFLGHESGEAARQLLRGCDLLEAALSERANRNAWLGTLHIGVSLRLPSEDERLQRLLVALRERRIDPFTRLDRKYSNQELDAAQWLAVRVATAGLLGGIDYGQNYEFASACKTCGAGAAPKPPLIVKVGSMGKRTSTTSCTRGT